MTAQPQILSREGLWGARLLRFESLPSTNGWIVECSADLGHGDVVWAKVQTAGRGRLNRTWLTVPGRCLAFSILLRDPRLVAIAASLGQIAAIAVQRALADLAIRALLKWPNDIVVEDRKIAGILAEACVEPGSFVLGIGLNVNAGEDDLQALGSGRSATSMRIEAGKRFAPRRVLASVRRQLEVALAAGLCSGADFVTRFWPSRDALAGRLIRVDTTSGPIAGRYSGLDEQGRLRVTDARGGVHCLWTGDVVHVRGRPNTYADADGS